MHIFEPGGPASWVLRGEGIETEVLFQDFGPNGDLDPTIGISRHRFHPGVRYKSATQPDRHRAAQEIFQGLEGEMWIEVEGQRFVLKPGSILVVLPGEAHWMGADEMTVIQTTTIRCNPNDPTPWKPNY